MAKTDSHHHNGPKSGVLSKAMGMLLLKAFGWRIVGSLPDDKKYVLVGAHHTSNWDFVLGLSTTFAFQLKTSWMGKHTLFAPPFGYLLRGMGGIPVDRRSAHGVVDQMVDALRQSDQMVLMLAADGTRRRMEFWKSGFYWIAHKAEVPIVCGYLDYSKKEAGFGLCFKPSGNVEKDMNRIREFYSTIRGKYPEQETAVRLKNET